MGLILCVRVTFLGLERMLALFLQFDRVVSQCNRAVSFGTYGRGFRGSFYVKLCILTL